MYCKNCNCESCRRNLHNDILNKFSLDPCITEKNYMLMYNFFQQSKTDEEFFNILLTNRHNEILDIKNDTFSFMLFDISCSNETLFQKLYDKAILDKAHLYSDINFFEYFSENISYIINSDFHIKFLANHYNISEKLISEIIQLENQITFDMYKISIHKK